MRVCTLHILTIMEKNFEFIQANQVIQNSKHSTRSRANSAAQFLPFFNHLNLCPGAYPQNLTNLKALDCSGWRALETRPRWVLFSHISISVPASRQARNELIGHFPRNELPCQVQPTTKACAPLNPTYTLARPEAGTSQPTPSYSPASSLCSTSVFAAITRPSSCPYLHSSFSSSLT